MAKSWFTLTVPTRSGTRSHVGGNYRTLAEARSAAKQLASREQSDVLIERETIRGKSTILERVRKNPKNQPEFPVGEYVPVEAVKVNEDGTINVVIKDSQLAEVLTENRRNGTRRNITAGFYDEEGIFHPIRASRDYDSARAGDRPRARAKSKAKRRKR